MIPPHQCVVALNISSSHALSVIVSDVYVCALGQEISEQAWVIPRDCGMDSRVAIRVLDVWRQSFILNQMLRM